jgi:hypothetical protein
LCIDRHPFKGTGVPLFPCNAAERPASAQTGERGLTFATGRRFLSKPGLSGARRWRRELLGATIAVLLIAAGAILYFATDLYLGVVSVDLAALIPMLAGLAVLLGELVEEGFWGKRLRARRTA